MRRLIESAQNDNDDLIEVVATALERAVARATASTASFAERERVAQQLSNEAVRRILERALQALADEEGDIVHHDVHAYRRHEKGTAAYHSLCGPLVVRRFTYRRIGIRNGETIVPLELRAGLIKNATPALAYALARGYANAGTRSVEQALKAAGCAPPSRSTLERMARSIGADAKKHVLEIERRVRKEETLPANATGVSIGIDRTTIPMEEEPTDEERRQGEARKVVVRYRMGYVGTVAITDAEGAILMTRRYAVPAHEGGAGVARRLVNDVRHALSANPNIHIGVVQDGAPELWNLVREALDEAGIPRSRYHEVIDIFHLFERVASALELVEPNARVRRRQLARWKKRILRDDSTIARIAIYFELIIPTMNATWRRYPGRWTREQRRGLEKLLDGYLTVADHFHYTKMIKRGLHVGSGITEGACKSLITERAKRSGQRWSRAGISAVLTLRSLEKSDRFDAFWRRFAQRHAPLGRAA